MNKYKIISSKINIYVDGSCIFNGKKNAIGGYGIYFPHNPKLNISKKYTFDSPATNQKCELYAMYKAIKICNKLTYAEYNIYTDSMYVINCLTKWIKAWENNNWLKKDNEAPLNLDLIKKLWNVYNINKNSIHLHFVKAHTNKKDEHSINNDIADQLAKKSY